MITRSLLLSTLRAQLVVQLLLLLTQRIVVVGLVEAVWVEYILGEVASFLIDAEFIDEELVDGWVLEPFVAFDLLVDLRSR